MNPATSWELTAAALEACNAEWMWQSFPLLLTRGPAWDSRHIRATCGLSHDRRAGVTIELRLQAMSKARGKLLE
jgi:hypothetical protein